MGGGDRLADILLQAGESNLESFLLEGGSKNHDLDGGIQQKLNRGGGAGTAIRDGNADAHYECQQQLEEEPSDNDDDLLDLGEVEAAWRASRQHDLATAPMTKSMRGAHATAGHQTGIKGIIQDYKYI